MTINNKKSGIFCLVWGVATLVYHIFVSKELIVPGVLCAIAFIAAGFMLVRDKL
jgi:hypothetical protein